MNKTEFLSALESRLHSLPKEDIKKSLDYYSEIIDDHIEDGISEDGAVMAVGSIDEIASQIFMETPLTKLVKEKVKPNRALKAWEIILLVLGSPVWLPLLAAAVIIFFSVYIVIWSVIAVLYAADLSLAAGGLAGIFGFIALTFAEKAVTGILFLGAGLICAGTAILLFFGFNQLTKGIISLSKRILRGIKACFAGKGELV